MGLVAANGGFGCGSRSLEPQVTQTLTERAIERRPERGQARGVVGQRGVDDRRVGRGHGDAIARGMPEERVAPGATLLGAAPRSSTWSPARARAAPGAMRHSAPSMRSSSAIGTIVERDPSPQRPDGVTVRHRSRPRRVVAPSARSRSMGVGPQPRRSGYPRASVRGSGLSTIETAPCGKPKGRAPQVSADGRLARAGRPMLRRTTSMTSSV